MKTLFPLLGLCFFGATIHSAIAQPIFLELQHAACGGANGSAWAGADTTQLGPGPLSYFWFPEPGSGQGTEAAYGLSPGDHTITITNGLGDSFEEEFTIDALPGLNAAGYVIDTVWTCEFPCNGSRTLHYGPTGGVGPYTGTTDAPGATVSVGNNWSSVSGLCVGGPYSITISDSEGCSSVFTIEHVVLEMPAMLLDQSVTPSCPDGSTGSIHLEFDDPVSLYGGPLINSPEPALIHDLTGLPAGTYEIHGQGYTACNDTLLFEITVPSSMDGCGTITGTMFADLNSDCIQQGDEPGIPNKTIHLTPDPEDFVLTDANGNYSRDRLFGQHQLHFTHPAFSPICPTSLPVDIDLTEASPTVQMDLAMQYVLGGPDAFVHISAFPPRLNDTTPIWITVTNDSPYEMSGIELEFTFSPLQTYNSATIDPEASTATSLNWQLPSLAPFAQWQVAVHLELPLNTDLIGELVSYTATLVQPVADADPDNDTHALNDLIIAAYDPNDKVAITTNSQSHEYYFFGTDEFIDYTIRFQNTGNAPAEHVYLIDTISDMHSLPSLQILGASHDFEVQWQDDMVLRFDFPAIMLPDSTSDPLGSQGFVSFRLRHLENITFPGYVITNAADIFFDENPPIRTNTTGLLAIDPTNINETTPHALITIHPNPTRDQLSIAGVDTQNASWQIWSIDGRLWLEGRFGKNGSPIDVQMLAHGQYLLRVIMANGTRAARFTRE